jgi:hypothetical protein
MDIFESRRLKLRNLVAHAGGIAPFAEKHGYSSAQISQYLSRNYNSGRSLGERAARALEEKLGLPPGYLDWGDEMPTPASARVDYADGDEITPEARTRMNRWLSVLVKGSIATDVNGELQVSPDHAIKTVPFLKGNENMYALSVETTDLSPRIRVGEVVVVDPDRDPSPGDHVVLYVNEGGVRVVQYNFTRASAVNVAPFYGQSSALAVDFYRERISAMHVIVGIVDGRLVN